MSFLPVRLQAASVFYFLRLIIFWLAVFVSFRILFLVLYVPYFKTMPYGQIAFSLLSGVRLDLSTISYLILPAYCLWLLYAWSAKIVFQKINQYYHYIILFGMMALFVGNLNMYHEWETLLTYNVLDYLKDPGEVASFISGWKLAFLVVGYGLYFILACWLFNKWVRKYPANENMVTKLSLSLTLPLLFILMARGGWQLAPINESSAYYSDNAFLNQVAVNPYWYFIHSYLNRDPDHNPYQFIELQAAYARNQNLYAAEDSAAVNILTTDRPNIVIIILESWTAEIIEALNGEIGVTPEFNALRHEGVLFNHIYAAGSRTEHGLTSILGGFPPPPKISIINIPGKSHKLDNLNVALHNVGYHSSFYYGGEIGFANMKSYLLQSHFEKIIDKGDFHRKQLNSKWGAHDEFVFEKQLLDLRNETAPFFSVVLTLSSHEPFEVPVQTRYNAETESNKFRGAVYYADQCLGAYFKKAKQEPWYANTLFILVADHGHRLPQNKDTSKPPSKHIPLLLLGPVIKPEFRDMIVNIVGNQNDIATTLLHQLNLDASGFPRSKDLLNHSSRSFAYYTTNNYLGWVTSRQSVTYNYLTQEVWKSDVTCNGAYHDSIMLDAKAFLQTHFQDYLDY